MTRSVPAQHSRVAEGPRSAAWLCLPALGARWRHPLWFTHERSRTTQHLQSLSRLAADQVLSVCMLPATGERVSQPRTCLGHERCETRCAGCLLSPAPSCLLSTLPSFLCPLPTRPIAVDFISVDFSLLWPRGRVGGHGKGWHFLCVAVSACEGHSSCWATVSHSYSVSLSQRPRMQTAPTVAGSTTQHPSAGFCSARISLYGLHSGPLREQRLLPVGTMTWAFGCLQPLAHRHCQRGFPDARPPM